MRLLAMAPVTVPRVHPAMLAASLALGCTGQAGTYEGDTHAVVVDPGGASEADAVERWPAPSATEAWQSLVAQAQADYAAAACSYGKYLADYAAGNDFLNLSILAWADGPTIRLDPQGLPQVLQDGVLYYNPVTLSQYALTMHGRWTRGDVAARTSFFVAADMLLTMEDADGAFRYPFPFAYYLSGETFPPGWVSSMAQGHALSVFSRAYLESADPTYATAGERALAFLRLPVAQGGTLDTLASLDPSLARRPILEEYVATPSSYTLNGYMFTLLGLYDWSQMAPGVAPSASTAKAMFRANIDTLVPLLPYYDLGGFTAYDLGYLTWGAAPHIGVSYHAWHIALLHALHAVTGRVELRDWESRWSSYVAQ